jgi:hypothetical protein
MLVARGPPERSAVQCRLVAVAVRTSQALTPTQLRHLVTCPSQPWTATAWAPQATLWCPPARRPNDALEGSCLPQALPTNGGHGGGVELRAESAATGVGGDVSICAGPSKTAGGTLSLRSGAASSGSGGAIAVQTADTTNAATGGIVVSTGSFAL